MNPWIAALGGFTVVVLAVNGIGNDARTKEWQDNKREVTDKDPRVANKVTTMDVLKFAATSDKPLYRMNPKDWGK